MAAENNTSKTALRRQGSAGNAVDRAVPDRRESKPSGGVKSLCWFREACT
jgi:hypothetical protein